MSLVLNSGELLGAVTGSPVTTSSIDLPQRELTVSGVSQIQNKKTISVETNDIQMKISGLASLPSLQRSSFTRRRNSFVDNSCSLYGIPRNRESITLFFVAGTLTYYDDPGFNSIKDEDGKFLSLQGATNAFRNRKPSVNVNGDSFFFKELFGADTGIFYPTGEQYIPRTSGSILICGSFESSVFSASAFAGISSTNFSLNRNAANNSIRLIIGGATNVLDISWENFIFDGTPTLITWESSTIRFKKSNGEHSRTITIGSTPHTTNALNIFFSTGTENIHLNYLITSSSILPDEVLDSPMDYFYDRNLHGIPTPTQNVVLDPGQNVILSQPELTSVASTTAQPKVTVTVD